MTKVQSKVVFAHQLQGMIKLFTDATKVVCIKDLLLRLRAKMRCRHKGNGKFRGSCHYSRIIRACHALGPRDKHKSCPFNHREGTTT